MVLTINQDPRLQIGDAPLNSSTDQAALIWQTTGESENDLFFVQYRPTNSDTPWQTASRPTTFDVNTEDRLNHATTITGLDYNREYEYRVLHGRNNVLVDFYYDKFQTRLAPGDETNFSFVAYGDSASIDDNSGFRAVQSQINNTDAEFALLLGDNAYYDGTHREFDARFTAEYAPEALEWSASRIDYSAIGNHDTYTDDGQPYLDNYLLPEFANVPTAEKSYSFDYGNVHFATIDSNTLDDPLELQQELEFLKTDLQASNADWQVVFLHHPLAGVPDKDESPSDNYYRQVVPVLNDLGVDLLLTGHSHTYGWTYPLTGFNGSDATFVADTDKEYSKGDGVVQVVSGMGGESIRGGGFDNAPFVAQGFSSDTNPESTDGFSKVSVTSDRLTVDYIAAYDGRVIDSFSISNNPDSASSPSTSVTSNTLELSFQQGVNGYSSTEDTFIREVIADTDKSRANSLNVDLESFLGEVQSLVRFENIFGNANGQIADNAQIESARLVLNVSNPGDSIKLHRMLQNWSDTDTWNTWSDGIQADNIEAAATADAITGSVPTGMLSIDVTDSVTAWQDNPSSNFGWLILSTDSNGINFNSAEGAIAPRLIVEYQEDSFSLSTTGDAIDDTTETSDSLFFSSDRNPMVEDNIFA